MRSPAPRVTALVRNRVEGSANRRRQVYAAIDEALSQLDLPIARTLIPARDDFEKAAILQEPLVVWRPDHIGSVAFRSLADELDTVAA
jgi:cellulose biosynthesis protein BcsQ